MCQEMVQGPGDESEKKPKKRKKREPQWELKKSINEILDLRPPLTQCWNTGFFPTNPIKTVTENPMIAGYARNLRFCHRPHEYHRK
ncbi:hypothetical protein SUGI_0446800 [Cryptomeria japonica]|nr:hypothetical protein SUGI_0446800 [Cryptomeria japonica]